MTLNLKGSSREKMQSLLNDIKEYVVVVGSVAEGTSTEKSDIDFYVKTKPEKVVEKEIELNNYSTDGIEETYIDLIIEILEQYRMKWESEFVAYITTTNSPIQLEFSPFFDIRGKQKSKVVVYGVEMECYI